jgi:hypothetical protein
MNYWKAPVTYLLKTLAALAAYFLLAWSFPPQECKVNGRIIFLPSVFAQPFAGIAIILGVKTVIAIFAEVSLWWILNRPLPDTPGTGHTSKRTTARPAGNAAKVVSGPAVSAASEAETAFARYLQNAGRAAVDEVPVTADYASSSSQFGVPIFIVSVALTLVFLGFGWAMVEPGQRKTSFALALVGAVVSVCLYLRFGALLMGVSQHSNKSLLFRYVIVHGKAIQRVPLYSSTTTLQRCERFTNYRNGSTRRECAVLACTGGRRRLLSPWCESEAELSPLLARYRDAGFAVLPIKRPGTTWLFMLLLIVVAVFLLVLTHFVN